TVVDIPGDQVERWCAARISVPIDSTTCAYDSVLLRHGDRSWTWWLDLHHLVTDAVSSALVVEACAAAYRGSPLELASTLPTGASSTREQARRERAEHRWRQARDARPKLAPYGP